jgi:hypothetical protein
MFLKIKKDLNFDFDFVFVNNEISLLFKHIY